ncbi:MAG: sugar nucleotide-binding protein [Spirochaetales bacterium]|nr:sugar nucleotide-binding protein [Spirochaetales bacterium]
MIKLMNKRDSLKIVNDQHGSPTHTGKKAGVFPPVQGKGEKEFFIRCASMAVFS